MALLIGIVYGICFILPANSANQAFAATINPGASLTIANPSRSATVAPGEIGYLSTNVTYSATDTTSYTLRATYANGYNSLTSGSKTVAGVTNGTTGSSMASSNTDAWGFAWGNTGDNNANLQYYTMPAYGKTGTGMANGVVDSGTTRTAITKKIVFAAKFANNNANTGTYRTNVLLSLIATPKATYNYTLNYNANGGSGAPSSQTANSQDTTSYNFTISSTEPTKTNSVFLGWADSSTATAAQYSAGGTITLNSSNSTKTIYAVWAPSWSAMTTMQQMTPEACSAISTGNSKTLTDSRDNNSYTAAKLSDGKCWMTQNLRLKGGTSISRTDSDLDRGVYTSDAQTYTLPASSLKGFIAGGAENKMYNGTNTTNGAYYSWCVATAGTCRINDVLIEEYIDASSSICPKGWRLPSGAEYRALITKGSVKVGSDSAWVDGGNTGYWLGGSSANSAGSAYYPSSGEVINNGISWIGVFGNYWSGTRTIEMHFGVDVVETRSLNLVYGNTIRCIAK